MCNFPNENHASPHNAAVFPINGCLRSCGGSHNTDVLLEHLVSLGSETATDRAASVVLVAIGQNIKN